MDNLTIDRGQWLTGGAHKVLEDSRLFHAKSGLKCCLGVFGSACGLSDSSLKPYSVFSLGLRRDVNGAADWLATTLDEKDKNRFKANDVQDALVETNDRLAGIHQTRREAAIAYLFKKYGGIEVNFVGRYAEATSKARKAVKNAIPA